MDAGSVSTLSGLESSNSGRQYIRSEAQDLLRMAETPITNYNRDYLSLIGAIPVTGNHSTSV